MKQIIIRNGKEIERNMKEKHYDSNICIRVSKDTIEQLKKMAADYNTRWNTMVREILEEVVKMYKDGEHYEIR